jgi:outer membrane biosynthesis protein TonB
VIRINLVRSRAAAAPKPGKALISPREAITGGVLLVAAFGMLFYLASREKPAAAPEPPPKIAKAPEPKVETPLPPPKIEKAPEPKAPEPRVEKPEPPPSPPPKKVEARPPATGVVAPPESPPAAGCQVSEISVQKPGGNPTIAIRTTAEVKYISFELFKPDRIAIDVFNCRGAVTRAQASQAVQDLVVQKVRANQFRADVYRVVVDVSAMPRYQIRALDKGVEIRVLGKKP